jgi:hypothetical protein
MKESSPNDEWNWLKTNPSLNSLMELFPEEWRDVGQELVSALADGSIERLSRNATIARETETTWEGRIRKDRRNVKIIEAALPHLVRSRMFLLALDKCCLAAATGKASGKIRFNLINGYLIQKMFFSRHLTRKQASLGWFKVLWPLITQKRFLMPLVQPKGFYCFYSRILIKELAALIGDRPCLEIGAGDGTLARFLTETGIKVTATDNYGWTHAIDYPETVERIDGKEALDKYRPEVVICSWPPPGNNFEESVFSTRSVHLYLVIGSRHRFASGNWDVYTSQRKFSWEVDPRLSSYLIPPELESAVLVFRRIGCRIAS